MLKLLSSPLSPYGRKVRICAKVKGVMDRIDVETADTNVPHNPVLQKENPLAKIPVLILDDGTQLFDSHVICEYLDSLTPSPTLFPAAGAERFNTLTLGALDHLEKIPPDWGAHPDYGHITIACALGYLDFRHGGTWRAAHPRLVGWLDRFAEAVPPYAETNPA